MGSTAKFRCRGRTALGFLLSCLLTAGASGCAGPRPGLDNQAALVSTIQRPASGDAAGRTYWNGAYAEFRFPSVRLLAPVLLAPTLADRDYQSFIEGLKVGVTSGTYRALATSERFGAVLAPESPATPGTVPTAEVVCETEVLAHVTPSAYAMAPDPVFRDPRPKVILVYTLRLAGSGEVLVRYTNWAASHWEYGPWAMEELQALAVGISNEFGEILKD